MSSIACSDLSFSGGGRTRALAIRRMRQARAMRLIVDPRDGAVRLTLPRRAALAPALAWVEDRRGWIETALAALPPAQPIRAGGTIPFEGVPLIIGWEPGNGRAIRLAGDRLIVGGPEDMLARRVLRWLRQEALARLTEQSHRIAAIAGVPLGRIGVGDPRGRWGSCSASGDIRYSWRLVMAPLNVREATVAHEVAHRLHMHHGPAFHAAVCDLLGRDPAPERRWLRANGAALHWVGRD